MQITNETFPSGNPAIFVEGVAEKEFWIAPFRAVEISVRLLKAAQQNVQPTAFGVGMRARLAYFFIFLGCRLSKFGGG